MENSSNEKFFAFLRQFPLFFDKNMVYCYISEFSTGNVEQVEKSEKPNRPVIWGFFTGKEHLSTANGEKGEKNVENRGNAGGRKMPAGRLFFSSFSFFSSFEAVFETAGRLGRFKGIRISDPQPGGGRNGMDARASGYRIRPC